MLGMKGELLEGFLEQAGAHPMLHGLLKGRVERVFVDATISLNPEISINYIVEFTGVEHIFKRTGEGQYGTNVAEADPYLMVTTQNLMSASCLMKYAGQHFPP